MALPEIVIGSKLDAKGFKQAETAADKLNKNVKKLAATFGIAFSVQRIAAFGRESVRAFMDAEREGAVLANTMKNLGLSFDTSRVTGYIDSIGKLYGVTGEQAVPAMQALLSATGSVTKSQEIFNTALNVSASTGIDVAEVAKGLSQAYLGNRKALNQYNTGLTKAELQLKSFDEIQTTLDTRLKGSATEAAATYSGQLLILTEAANQAKEAIGKGLIDSFTILAGDDSLEIATTKMKDFGDQIAYALVGAADLLKKLQGIGKATDEGIILSDGTRATLRPSAFQELSGYGKKVVDRNRPMGAPGAISGKFPGGASYFNAQAKAEETALKRAKELRKIELDRLSNLRKIAAEKKKQEALDKAALILAQGKKVFDEEGIQLAAAAQGKLTEEEKVRIALKKDIYELEAAINEGNVTAAARLSSSMVDNARKLSALRGDMIGLGDVPNPFEEWLRTLEAMIAALKMVATVTPVSSSVGRGGTYSLADIADTEAARSAIGAASMLGNYSLGDIADTEAARSRIGASSPTYVTVNVGGSISTERDIVAAITQGLYAQQASGTPVNYSTAY
jgi:hypothetical protein